MVKHAMWSAWATLRVTDKVNIPELQGKPQQRIDMVTETAKRLAELSVRPDF
jgi:hypothetical protein